MVLSLFYGILAVVCTFISLQQGVLRGFFKYTQLIVLANLRSLLLGLVLLLLIINSLDAPVAIWCHQMYNVNFYTLIDFINSMGEGWFVSGVLFTIAIICFTIGAAKPGRVFNMAFMVSIIAGLMNAVLKFIFNRERPAFSDDPWNFFHFFLSSDRKPTDLLYAYNSMPSGHTITVVSALTVIYCSTNKKSIRVLLLILALLIMFARVYTLNHWLSDVFASSILGVVLGVAGFATIKK